MKDYMDLRIEWDAKIRKNDKCMDIMRRINHNQRITPQEVHDYAVILSNTLSEVLKKNIREDLLVDGKLPPEVANEVVAPLMRILHGRIDTASYVLQKQVNEAKGVGTNPVHADFDAGRVEGILNRLVSEYFDDAEWLLESPVENFGLNTISSFCKQNIAAARLGGIPMSLTRKAEPGACPWCRGLAGDYGYPAPNEVYRRHENCRCATYTIYPKGKMDVWSKNSFSNEVSENEVVARIREASMDRQNMRNKQRAWRLEQQREVDNASSYQELLAIAEKRGYKRGWAYHQWKAKGRGK